MLIRTLTFTAVALAAVASLSAQGDTVPSPVPSATPRSLYKMGLASILIEREYDKATSEDVNAFINSYVLNDPRLTPGQKKSLASELAAADFLGETTEFLKASIDELFTEEELAAVVEGGDSVPGPDDSKTPAAIRKALEPKYVEITHLSYPPQKVPEPDWFTKILWWLVPESDQCRAVAK